MDAPGTHAGCELSLMPPRGLAPAEPPAEPVSCGAAGGSTVSMAGVSGPRPTLAATRLKGPGTVVTTGSGGLSALAAAAAEKASGRSSGPPVYAKTASWKKRNLEDLIGPSEQLPTPASEAEPDPRGKRQEMGSSAPASAAAAPPTKPAAPAAAAGAPAHEAAAAAAGKADPAFSFPSLVPSAQHTTVRCYSRLGPQQAEQVPAKPAAAAPVPPADGAAVPRNNVALRALRDALKVQVLAQLRDDYLRLAQVERLISYLEREQAAASVSANMFAARPAAMQQPMLVPAAAPHAPEQLMSPDSSGTLYGSGGFAGLQSLGSSAFGSGGFGSGGAGLAGIAGVPPAPTAPAPPVAPPAPAAPAAAPLSRGAALVQQAGLTSEDLQRLDMLLRTLRPPGQA